MTDRIIESGFSGRRAAQARLTKIRADYPQLYFGLRHIPAEGWVIYERIF